MTQFGIPRRNGVLIRESLRIFQKDMCLAQDHKQFFRCTTLQWVGATMGVSNEIFNHNVNTLYRVLWWKFDGLGRGQQEVTRK